MTTSSKQAAQKRHDELSAALAAAKIDAARVAAEARVAGKDTKVSLAVAAAEAKAEVGRLTEALKTAAKDLKIASAVEYKKARMAAQEAAEALEQSTEVNPFAREEISWPAIATWVSKRIKDGVCYVEAAGWGEWTGTHWEFSLKPSPELLKRVRQVYSAGGGAVLEKLNANPRSANYVLEHAQADLTLPRSLFNSREVAHLAAFQNCTVDLRTGKSMPNDPGHYMTGAFECNYNPKADAERVVRTFARFWPEDPDTARCFQLALGYTMTAEVSAKRVFFLVGNQEDSSKNGDNGKSLVQGAMARLFGLGGGGWGTTVKSSLIVDTGDRDANSHDGAKVPLIWRRFALASEFRLGATIDAGEFNRVSGGDPQSARPPHAERAQGFINFASLWLSMNTVPRFKTWDKATRRRLTPFEFKETFYDPEDCPEGGQLKELGLEMWLESTEGQEALALYAVQGAIAFYKHNGGKPGNLPDSVSMLALRDRILRAGNPFIDLFEECFEFNEAFDLKQSAVTTLLHVWSGNRPKPHEKEQFVSALKGMGVIEVKVRGERYFRGVGFTGEGMKRYGSKNTDQPQVSRNGPVVVPMAAAVAAE